MQTNRVERRAQSHRDPANRNDGRHRGLNVPAFDAPEERLVVSFEGLTDAEARQVLSGFPGGQRFLLQTH